MEAWETKLQKRYKHIITWYVLENHEQLWEVVGGEVAWSYTSQL